ncbi:MAG: dihydropteroate synthase [Planctomycetota bacterium]
MSRIFGILNLTHDSFSDGGRYIEPHVAVEHARRMIAAGAYAIDVGAESSHPDAENVSAEEEIARLTPVIRELKAEGMRISVDTYKPTVMRHVLDLGVDYINDITALRNPEAVAVVRDADVGLIIMHSIASTARAERRKADPARIMERILEFFRRRLGELAQASVDPERIILDPGMGFFLGSDAQASVAVLRELPRLSELGLPVLVSTSRKSFIGALLGTPDQPRPPSERAAGTLATELWAARQGAAYIRTHDVGALHDALTLWDMISEE